MVTVVICSLSQGKLVIQHLPRYFITLRFQNFCKKMTQCRQPSAMDRYVVNLCDASV